MYIIGLTGGIACGKSTVTSMLRSMDVKVIDADEVAHSLMSCGRTLWCLITEKFGRDILDENEEIDRKKLGKIVFNDPEKLALLNSISHHLIKSWINVAIRSLEDKGNKVVVLDVPLLIETGWYEDCNEIWVVSVSEEIQKKRLMDRNNLTADEAAARIASQMSLREKRKYADVVIDNSGDLFATQNQVKKFGMK